MCKAKKYKILSLFFWSINRIIYIIGVLFTAVWILSFVSISEGKYELDSALRTQEIKDILSKTGKEIIDKRKITPTVITSEDKRLRSKSIFITSGGVVVIIDNTGRIGIIGRPHINNGGVIWECKSLGAWPLEIACG